MALTEVCLKDVLISESGLCNIAQCQQLRHLVLDGIFEATLDVESTLSTEVAHLTQLTRLTSLSLYILSSRGDVSLQISNQVTTHLIACMVSIDQCAEACVQLVKCQQCGALRHHAAQGQ